MGSFAMKAAIRLMTVTAAVIFVLAGTYGASGAPNAVSDLQRLLDERAISRKVMEVSRGADRGDRELFEQAYWPDGTDEHSGFSGSAKEFVAYTLKTLTDAHTHLML